MTDARTEARLRFVQALVDHRLVGPYCKCGFTPFGHGEYERHLANALLALFPEVVWGSVWRGAGLTVPADPPRVTHRQLTLSGPVEAVAPEEPQPYRPPTVQPYRPPTVTCRFNTQPHPLDDECQNVSYGPHDEEPRTDA